MKIFDHNTNSGVLVEIDSLSVLAVLDVLSVGIMINRSCDDWIIWFSWVTADTSQHVTLDGIMVYGRLFKNFFADIVRLRLNKLIGFDDVELLNLLSIWVGQDLPGMLWACAQIEAHIHFLLVVISFHGYIIVIHGRKMHGFFHDITIVFGLAPTAIISFHLMGSSNVIGS